MKLFGDQNQCAGFNMLGQFALVSYIPDPLARFLDDLRLEINPDSNPRAHVTILPPRPLHAELKDSIQELSEELRSAPPFEVEVGDIEMFERTKVIYAALKKGIPELRRLYGLLNCGCLEHKENFPYHPHVTIGQNVPLDQVDHMAAVARQRWAEYKGPRSFTVQTLSFVQQVAPAIWADVASLQLGTEVPVSAGGVSRDFRA